MRARRTAFSTPNQSQIRREISARRWLTADKDATKADWLYRTGYYYQAKKKQLLEVIHAD